MVNNQNERLREFFSSFADTWDTLYGGKRNIVQRWFDRRLRRDIYERYEFTFKRLGSDLSNKTILDIGCGSGIYSLEAARRGAESVVGVDVADQMVSLANDRSSALGFGSRCAFVRTIIPPDCDIASLESTFDYAIVMGIMDYVEDEVDFLAWCRKHVRGFAVISFPGRHWFREPLRRYRYRLSGRCNIYGYDEVGIRASCSRAGFSHVDICRLDHSGICFLVTAHA